MPRPRLPWVALLCTLALVVAFALITPRTGTQAKWVDQQQVSLPGLSTGRINLNVQPTTQGRAVEAGLSNASGFGLEYAPTQVRLEARPGSTTTASDVNTFLNLGAGTSFAFSSTTGCAASTTTPRWSSARVDNTTTGSLTVAVTGTPAREPLTDGATRALCLGVRPDATTQQLLLSSAGREFQATTTLQAATVAPGSWATTVPWASVYAVALPTATPRTCTAGTNGTSFTLGWAWPDTTAATNPTTTPAIDRWEVLVRGRTSATASWGAWSSRGTVDGDRRNVTITPTTTSPWSGNTRYQIKVRAYPFAGNTKYVESSTLWESSRTSTSATAYTCATTYPTNPTPGPAGYDGLSLG